MRFNKFILLITFFMGCLQSCINHSVDGQLKKPGIVPNLYYNAVDPLFRKSQDTMYLNEHLFSGYLYAMYNPTDTALVIGYLNGLQEGRTKKWYMNKQLCEERWYVQGGKEGVHRGWWEDGKPKFVYHFLNDEFEGLVTEWFNNGKLFRQFHYTKGYETGSQKMWWENGGIRANYVVTADGQRFGLSGQKLCINAVAKVNAK